MNTRYSRMTDIAVNKHGHQNIDYFVYERDTKSKDWFLSFYSTFELYSENDFNQVVSNHMEDLPSWNEYPYYKMTITRDYG